MSHTGGLHNILRYATKNPTRGDVIVPGSDGGGTDSVEPEEGGDVVHTGDDHVHSHIDEGEGAFQVTVIYDPVLMDTSGDDKKLNNIEYEFVYIEKDTMGDVGVVYKETELCPTGGLDNILRFETTFDGGGDACILVKVDEKDVNTVPIDDSGSTEPIKVDDQGDVHARVQAEEEEDVNQNIAAIVDVNVHTHIDEGGGAVRVNERRDDDDSGGEHVHIPVDDLDNVVETKVDEEDVMAQHVDNNHDDKARVDGGAMLPKTGDQMEVMCSDLTVLNRRFVRHQDPALRNIQSPRSVMGEPVQKSPPVQQQHVREPPPARHDDVHCGGEQGHHDASDRDQGVLHNNEDDVVPGQDGAADDPIERGPAPAELTKQVGTAESLHTMEESLMKKQDWFVYAADDGDAAVAKYNEAGGDGTVNATVEKAGDLTKVVEDQGDVHVPAHIDEGGGEIKPEVDTDQEGGGDVPTPDKEEAGKLGILMTKQKCFGHERGGGIAKSACGNCAFHAGSER
jgi:hypothetical protein